MKSLSLLIFIFVFSFISFAQEKKTAALAPLGSMGDLDEIQKRVIFNTLQESLSKYFILSSQKMYEKAEEEAFQQMDANECTEDQCIAIIQELLQVEYFFMFEILQSRDFQQLKITRVDLDGNRDVRTSTCESCNISQTNSKVDQLVLSLFEQFAVREDIIVTRNDKQTDIEVGASAYWEMIKDSKDKLKYQDFIMKFPNSTIKTVAQIKIDEIERKENELKAEQQRKQKERERKQNEIEERKIKLKHELSLYWENKKCKDFSIHDNFYRAEIFLLSRPYGLDANNGKIVNDVEKADILYKDNNLIGNDSGGTNVRFLRFGAIPFSIFATYGYSTSFISNTECYQSRNNLNIVKKYTEFNYKGIHEDLVRGKGDYLEALFTTFGCPSYEFKNLNLAIKTKYNKLFEQSSYHKVQVNKIIVELNKIIENDPWLKASCNAYSPVDVVSLIN